MLHCNKLAGTLSYQYRNPLRPLGEHAHHRPHPSNFASAMHRNWMKSITRLVDALTTPGFGRPSWPPKPVKPLKPTTRGESLRRVRPTPTQGTFVRRIAPTLEFPRSGRSRKLDRRAIARQISEEVLPTSGEAQ